VGEVYSAAAMIKTLVNYDTTSCNSNLEFIRFIEDYLAGHGAAPHLFYNAAGDKANLFATIGGEGGGGVILSGHSDVVPARREQWSGDPFQCVEKDGRLYGRGTCDMKGFLGTVLAAVPEFTAARLRKPVHLAVTYDEETNLAGAFQLAPQIAAMGIRPEAVIIGEPTAMTVINAHKGHSQFRVHVAGVEAHASQTHRGVNAIAAAAKLISFLEQLAAEARAAGAEMLPTEPGYATINVGAVSGGTQINVVPGRCSFDWEIRTIPSFDAGALVQKFRDYAQTLTPAKVRHETLLQVPAYAAAPDSPAVALAAKLTGNRRPRAVTYSTEAPCYRQAGMPAAICGPGSIDQAHKPDEFIAVSEVAACENFLRKLMRECAG